MIIQCDHCKARFRMDDSKLANGPVKVRCAKCKEVFIVRPEEPAVESVVPPLPERVTPAAESAESTDFSFDTPAASNDSFSQGSDDFSFDSQNLPVSKADDTAQTDAANEFDWQEGASNTETTGTGSDFNLSSFDASLAAASASVEAAASAAADDNDFDFGDVDFNAAASSPAKSPEVAETGANDDFSVDFGEVSFSEDPVDSRSSTETVSAAPALADEPSDSDFLLSFNSDAGQQQGAAATGQKQDENVNSDEFSVAGKPFSPASGDAASTTDLQGEAPGGFAAAGFSPEEQEEELPPSSLTSRKKSGSSFPLLVIAGAIILVIALAGSGVYFFGGPKAFSKVGLGFLVEWYGDKAADEGSIALQGVTASYAVNSTAGELFVVRGEAVNNFMKPRASIQIKVSLLGPGGTSLVSKSAFCGNSLSDEQLATLPLAKIEEIMNNQFGDSLTNIGLKPGGTIPFVVVVSPLPKEATDYTVVVGGSTVATQ